MLVPRIRQPLPKFFATIVPVSGIQRGSSRNHASCQICKLRNGNRNHA
jgi:hypothetical protein